MDGEGRRGKPNGCLTAAGPADEAAEKALEGDGDQSPHAIDPAVHAMLQGQHDYYNNVHVIQEQVGCPAHIHSRGMPITCCAGRCSPPRNAHNTTPLIAVLKPVVDVTSQAMRQG